MKKLLQILGLAFLSLINAQQWTGTNTITSFISRTGNVSIGTTENLDKFNLSGNLRILGNSGTNKILFGGGNNVVGGIYNVEFNSGKLYLYPSGNIFPDDGWPDPQIKQTLVLSSTSTVGIGTDNLSCSSCAGYRLFVKDGIRTEKVKVDVATTGSWADYVFNEDYKLMDLSSVEKFIKENKHLPEIPSAEEVVKNGVELKEMNTLLLKKVEELTLYTIDQEKRMNEQQKQIDELKQMLIKK